MTRSPAAPGRGLLPVRIARRLLGQLQKQARRSWRSSTRVASRLFRATPARVLRKQLRAAWSRSARRFAKQRERWRTSHALRLERWASRVASLNATYSPAGERRSCPACDGRALALLDVMWRLRAGDIRSAGFITGCRTCGLVFANPLPTSEELEAYYAPDSEYVEERWHRQPEPARPPSAAHAAPAAHGDAASAVSAVGTGDERLTLEGKQDKLVLLFSSVARDVDIMRPPPGAKVLDYGCGPGRVLDRLQPVGWDTFGLEPALKTAFERHKELVALPDQPTFTLVIVHHVLEHLLNPLDVLRQIAASMIDGGIIYISVPRFDAIDRHGDLRYTINSHGHVMAYTRESMTTLLAMAGLQALPVENDELLDRLFTRGEPRRMRLFARKTREAIPRPPSPLAAAERALAAYRARFEPPTRWAAMTPVRLRAAWLQQARRGQVLAHRSRKLGAR